MWKNNRNREASLAKASPGALDRWRGDIESAMERFFRDPFHQLNPFAGSDWLTPRMNVSETDREVVVNMELPGVNPEDLQIDVTGDRLTVRGEKCGSQQQSDGGYQYNECEYGSFFRSIDLPGGVNSENVQARCTNGMLTITLEKRPESQSRRISVQSDKPSTAPLNPPKM